MTAKISTARRDAFLFGLRETGNQTLAAERAKVSQAWVQGQRKADPLFRQAVEEAVRDARMALRHAQHERDGCGAGYFAGAELVVRGTAGSGARRVQVARSRLRQWTPRVEERFLSVLAESCNVKAACAEVALTAASAYNHRRRWQAFAERWDAAVELGYTLLEVRLVEAAGNLFSAPRDVLAEPGDTSAPLGGMTAQHALQLLHMHKHRARGIGKPPGRLERAPDMDEIRASILRKIEAIERVDRLREERRLASTPDPRQP